MTERILIFFALAGLGWAFRKGGLLTRDGVRDLIRLNMDVCVPALTFVTAATRLTPAVAALGYAVAALRWLFVPEPDEFNERDSRPVGAPVSAVTGV